MTTRLQTTAAVTAAGALGVLLVLGCGWAIDSTGPADVPAPAAAPASGEPPHPTATAPPTGTRTDDRRLCRSLEVHGRGYYATFGDMIRRGSASATLPDLTVQLAYLGETGSAGDRNGTELADAASRELGQAAHNMIRAARLAATEYAAQMRGAAGPPPDSLSTLNRWYAETLVACADRGHGPVWFDAAELLGG
jgi:hypothetical protein